MIVTKRFFFDIETFVPNDEAVLGFITDSVKPPKNYKSSDALSKWFSTERQQKIQEAFDSAALNPMFSMIASIAYTNGQCNSSDDVEILINETFDMRGEKELLERLIRLPHVAPPSIWVGHNIHGFDIPFIRCRCIVHGINFTKILPDAFKYSSPFIYDTMLNWYPKKFESLNMISKCLGLGSKLNTGNSVRDMILSGDIDSLIAYNKHDTYLVKQIYNRMTFEGVK